MLGNSGNPFDSINLDTKEEKTAYSLGAEKNPFLIIDTPEEGYLKSAFRTAYQPISGALQSVTYPADLFNILATGSALDQEEIDSLKRQAKIYGIPFDEEKYKNAALEQSQSIPTQGNIERFIEEKTGAPLEAKTGFQKGLKLAGTAGAFQSGALSQKAVASATAPAVSQGLQSVGVPEILADTAGLGTSALAGSITPKVDIVAKTKPSGLTTQRFEKITSPKEISESAIKKVNDRLEKEFKTIADNIIKESPIKETYENLKNDFSFKNKSSQEFEKVRELAQLYPNKFKTSEFTKELLDNSNLKKNKGLTPSEFDKRHHEFINEFVKDTKKKDFTVSDLEIQYRKNNESLGEAFEPGQSFAYNNAKREALLDYNKTIADVIEKEFPNSEFSKLFKETNKRWTEISDAQAIDKFFDSLFDGKIQYKKGREFFDKQGMTVPFKRAMGKEGFAKFETLMSDLMSTEQASKLLRQAKDEGFKKFASSGLSYLIHPKLAAAKVTVDAAKGLQKGIFEFLIDKPQYTLNWQKGLNAAKKGNFKTATEEFDKIDKAIDPRLEKAKIEAIKKFRENSTI